jgi:hypothetical protein
VIHKLAILFGGLGATAVLAVALGAAGLIPAAPAPAAAPVADTQPAAAPVADTQPQAPKVSKVVDKVYVAPAPRAPVVHVNRPAPAAPPAAAPAAPPAAAPAYRGERGDGESRHPGRGEGGD